MNIDMNLTKSSCFVIAILLFCFRDASSEPVQLSARESDDKVILSFQSIEGVHYRLQTTFRFRTNTVWTTTSNILGSGEIIEVMFPSSSNERYFKISTKTNPLYGKNLFVKPSPRVLALIESWNVSRPDDALTISKTTNIATAQWFTEDNGNSISDVSSIMQNANESNAVPVLVAYNIPLRDCNSFSQGGANSSEEYIEWITEFASRIDTNEAVVILEPDALPNIDCALLSSSNKVQRLELLSQAVNILRQNEKTYVYIDAGHSAWISDTQEVARRLRSAGITNAHGFSLNISNFRSNTELTSYGTAISRHLEDVHFILDTSRNGRGPLNLEWCNPPGRALGNPSTTKTDNPLIDMMIYVKEPSESDGGCNGGPEAGDIYPEYFLGLAERASF